MVYTYCSEVRTTMKQCKELPQVRKTAQGTYKVNHIFKELCSLEDDKDVKFSYSIDTDGDDCHSLRQLYLSYNDPSEYDFAVNEIGSFEFWDTIRKHPKIEPFYQQWRKEFEQRELSKLLRQLKTVADDPTAKESLQAARYILDKVYLAKDESNARGVRDKIRERKELEQLRMDAESAIRNKEAVESDCKMLRLVK